jgi:hypothetical protein
MATHFRISLPQVVHSLIAKLKASTTLRILVQNGHGTRKPHKADFLRRIFFLDGTLLEFFYMRNKRDGPLVAWVPKQISNIYKAPPLKK